MKAFKITAAALFLCGCSTHEEREREALMNRIEEQVQLPKGARPLREYARFYAQTGGSEIHAIYLIPISGSLKPGEGCSEMTENFSLKEVPCEPVPDFPGLAAGQRKWVLNEYELPDINGGGCRQVNVIFDKASSAVREVSCNGML